MVEVTAGLQDIFIAEREAHYALVEYPTLFVAPTIAQFFKLAVDFSCAAACLSGIKN